MSRRVPGLVLLLALALAAHAGAANWVRVETPSFVVYGDVGERLLQDLASQFERFREALARLFPASLARTPVPTVVVAFGTERAYDPYRPLFNGRRVEISGYFYAQEDLNVVTLRVDDRELALRTIFHEYAHILLANVAGELPAWVNEGLAEPPAPSLRPTDAEAAIGRRYAARPVAAGAELPLEQLLRVTVDSPLYNRGTTGPSSRQNPGRSCTCCRRSEEPPAELRRHAHHRAGVPSNGHGAKRSGRSTSCRAEPVFNPRPSPVQHHS